MAKKIDDYDRWAASVDVPGFLAFCKDNDLNDREPEAIKRYAGKVLFEHIEDVLRQFANRLEPALGWNEDARTIVTEVTEKFLRRDQAYKQCQNFIALQGGMRYGVHQIAHDHRLQEDATLKKTSVVQIRSFADSRSLEEDPYIEDLPLLVPLADPTRNFDRKVPLCDASAADIDRARITYLKAGKSSARSARTAGRRERALERFQQQQHPDYCSSGKVQEEIHNLRSELAATISQAQQEAVEITPAATESSAANATSDAVPAGVGT